MDLFNPHGGPSRRFAPLPGRPIRLVSDLERNSTLLMDFDGRRSPVVRFSFDAGEPDPDDGSDLQRIVDGIDPLPTSTRAAHRLGLVGPVGSDDDVVERVVIGPTIGDDEEGGPADV